MYQQVAAEIRNRIESGLYARRLPSVVNLSQEFGTSRNTILLGLNILRDLGLIYVVRNRGYFVHLRSVVVVAPEPGMRIIARMPTADERENLGIDDDRTPVQVIERPDGTVEILPANISEIRLSE